MDWPCWRISAALARGAAEIRDGFDGVYDRAAMIALPAELRARYTAHLQTP
jgi:hypothetical protein